MNSVLIDGRWRRPSASTESFRPVNPATGLPLDDRFPISPAGDVDVALKAGAEAADEFPGLDPEPIARFLEAFALRLEEKRLSIAERAALETALPEEPRLLSVEFPRMTDQIRQAAAAVRDRSWRHAVIDTQRKIRSLFEPIGRPVVVFGPSNFPLAFNAVGGGDFVAALASGNPVIAKGHPGHPGTTRLLAEAAFEALKESGLPRSYVQMVYHVHPEDGIRLASHPLTGALAFTGSRESGLKLKEAADRWGKPIYLEMSSVNPLILLPGAVAERSPEMAREFARSLTAGSGQFCTKPGLVLLLRNRESERFYKETGEEIQKSSPGCLLGESTLDRLERSAQNLASAGAILTAGGTRSKGPGFRFPGTLFRISGQAFIADPGSFQAEAFGALAVFVFAENAAELKDAVNALEPGLTGTFYLEKSGCRDDTLYRELEPSLRRKVGRIINDKMPTGVAVSPAMNHGGPFPATGHPGFTSVGIPASFLRFCALRCYDGVREDRLPAELRDRNPTGKMWRSIDGEWTRRDI